MNSSTAEPREPGGPVGPEFRSAGRPEAIRSSATDLFRRIRPLVLLILYCITTGVVLTLFVVRPGIEGHPRATFTDLVQGRAHKPFAFRILVPTLIRGISAVTPDALEAAVEREYARKRIVTGMGWTPDSIYEHFVAMAVVGLCFLATLYVWRRLTARLFHFPHHVADTAPVFGLLALTLFFRYCNYVYDPATVLLFSLAVIALEGRNNAQFYVIFTLAALNKETSLLLIPLFFARERADLATRRLLAHGGALMGLWFCVRFFVVYLFRDNPGALVEFHLADHNLRLPLILPGSTAYFAGVLISAAWLARKNWTAKPLFLRRGLLITFIPLLVGSLLFGFVDELRGYYEAYPFVFLLSVPTMCAVLGIPETAATDGV